MTWGKAFETAFASATTLGRAAANRLLSGAQQMPASGRTKAKKIKRKKVTPAKAVGKKKLSKTRKVHRPVQCCPSPTIVAPLDNMRKGGYGWDVSGRPGVKYKGDGKGGVTDGLHNGIDLKAEPYTTVKSPERGSIIETAYNANKGQLTVEILGDSGYTYRFVHMSSNPKIENAKKPIPVGAGDPIGAVGDAKVDYWCGATEQGKKGEPHLHLSVLKDGKFIDPGKVFDF